MKNFTPLKFFLLTLSIRKSFVLFIISFFIFSYTEAANITFRVDMSGEVVSSNGVYITGTIDNWALTTEMTQVAGTNFYEATFVLDDFSGHRFKFFNGNSWADEEDIPEAYNVGNDRIIIISDQDQTFDYVFSGAPITEHVAYEFNVDMTGQTVQDVRIVGNFNAWDPGNCIMEQVNTSDIYRRVLYLPPGMEIIYKFINGDVSGDQWVGVEELAGLTCVNADNNRVLELPANTYTVTHNFNGCEVSTYLSNSIKQSVAAYPNPVNGVVFLQGVDETSVVEVINTNGTVVKKQDEISDGVDLGHLEAGIYWLRISNSNGTVVLSVIKN